MGISTLTGFNPRTHMGCDVKAPCAAYLAKWFQSMHPHGVRRIEQFMGYRSFQFQSTHPHGVRPSAKKSSLYLAGFNPRTHMGCDFVNNDAYFPVGMFQSTHPHGVRPYNEILYPGSISVSIHAPTWGATCYLLSCIALITVSIHAPTWGATCTNHTHPR